MPQIDQMYHLFICAIIASQIAHINEYSFEFCRTVFLEVIHISRAHKINKILCNHSKLEWTVLSYGQRLNVALIVSEQIIVYINDFVHAVCKKAKLNSNNSNQINTHRIKKTADVHWSDLYNNYPPQIMMCQPIKLYG